MPSRKTFEPGVTSTGGHVLAQSPVQVDRDGAAVSLSKRYRVKPAPLRTMGFSPLAEPPDSWTHFIEAGLSGTVTKSPVFGAALFCWAVPVLKATLVAAGPVGCDPDGVLLTVPLPLGLLALPVLQ